MRNLSKSRKRGVSLIAAIAIMLIAAVLTLVMVSMLGTTSRIALNSLYPSQALGLAQAGLNWYMMQLVGIPDWDTASNQSGISLNPGTFDVAVSNRASPQTDSITPTRMDISVTGKVTGAGGNIIQRTMSQRALKLPSASKFALFWGRRTGTALTLTSTTVNGDFWSQGTTAIPGISSVTNGSAYRPTTENISGVGSYTEVNVGSFPYFSNFPGSTATFSTPQIDTTYYTNLITNYNNLITTSPASADLSQSSGTFNVSGIMRRRNVTLDGTVTITGNGILIANGIGTRGVMTLGSNSGGPVIIRPDAGGTITFLARRNLTVNIVTISNTNNPSPDYYPRVRVYSQAVGTTSNPNSDLMTIQNSANLDRALLLSDRRILVQTSTSSPIITNSTFFVNNNSGSNTNNNLTVTNSSTVGNSATGSSSLISIARGSPALAITTTASVRGFVYQRDAGNAGYTNIAGTSSANRVNITGSIIANQFTSNRVLNANITYNPNAIPDPPPEGFNSFVTKKPNSWSGN
jgi:hypothetical protein